MDKKDINNKKSINELTTLAASLLDKKQFRAAAKIYLKACKLSPDNYKLLNMLSISLKLIKKNKWALQIMEKVNHLNPNDPFILNNLGTMYLDIKEKQKARACFETALSLKPDFNDVAVILAKIYNNDKQFDKTVALMDKQLALTPDDKKILLNKAFALTILQQYQQAFTIFLSVIPEFQNDVNFVYYMSVCAYNLRKFAEAATLFQKCISLDPNNATYWNYLGVTQKNLKNRNYLAEVRYFRKGIHLEPDNINIYHNLANTFIAADKLAIAKKILLSICENDSTFFEAFVSLGYVYHLLGDYSQAEKYYRSSLQHSPNNPDAHANLALLMLSLGDFDNGWDEYEWRWQHKALSDIKSKFTDVCWQGETLDNKTLVIFTEQGFGDTIQFVRYLPLINKGTGKIIIECRDPIVDLIKTVKNIDHVIPSDSPVPKHDYYVPLISLPKIFNTNINSIPNDVPYLLINPQKQKTWAEYFSQYPNKFKIGITWAGNPRHRHDRYRTIKPKFFQQLKMNDKVVLFSLQKDDVNLHHKTYGFVSLAEQLHDFTDTAACIANLDLIISVDTAIVHLAGALNLPVWTLLGFYCDWRWLKERTDTPWYPSMRLFRQPKRHDWESVFDKVKQELNGML